jgi:signal peptidase II
VNRKTKAFWPLLSLLVLADCGTKQLAVEHLSPPHIPHDVVGDVLRFTLAYNPGAAFSTTVGPYSRWIFLGLAMVVLVVLGRLYLETEKRDAWQATALALVAGGALGNALDRVRSPRGVVDFIDIGFGDVRFWTFNIADVGVTFGALLLATMLWRRDAQAAAQRSPQ